MTQRKAFRNWARTEARRPEQVHRPRDAEHAAALLEALRERGDTARILGAAQSPGDIALHDGALLPADALRQPPVIDAERRQVRAGAGSMLAELSRALAARRLALCNLGSISRQQLGGGLATGTHGTGLRHGILATAARAVQLATSAGEVL